MKLRTLFVFTVIAFAAVADVRGSFDTYIKTVPAVNGEVTSPAAFVNAWAIFSFSAGASMPVTTSASGLTAGRAAFSDLSVMKQLDKASVELLLKLAQGVHMTSVTLSCVNHATNALVYEVKLEEVLFSSIQHSGSAGGDDRPAESVSMTYGKITWTYYPPTGSPITHFWDIRSNSGG